jgi:hypothetical protein
MNKIEQRHLYAIDTNISTIQLCNDDDIIIIVGKETSAFQSAEITEQIAIEFLEYYSRTATLDFQSSGENTGKSYREVYQQFLKTKQ